MLRNSLAAAGAIFLLFLVFNVLDQAEKTFLAWSAYREQVADSCLPMRASEMASAWIHNGKLVCEIKGNVGYGRAPEVVSLAAMEVPR